MIAKHSYFRVILLAAVIFMLASPGMARPAQKQADAAAQILLPITFKTFSFGPGTVTGYVLNASVPQEPYVGKALVCWGSNCVLSKDGVNDFPKGEYTLENVANGHQTLTASADGFITTTQTTFVVGNMVNTQDIAIIPDVVRSGVKYRVMVTWDPTPCWPDPNGTTCWDNDLDLHMWRWDSFHPVTYHIGYYLHYDPLTDKEDFWLDPGDCRSYPMACLEMDARKGYGPETLAIKEREPAMYYFGVFNSNQGRPGVPPISQTRALVRLYDKTGLVKSYQVSPTGGDKVFWYVFSLKGETGVITDQNCIIDYIPDYDTTTWPTCP
jgi:hypothetical protein